MDRTLRRAIRSASERGYDAEAVKAVLAVGGSSQIPAVQSTLRRIFGRERVLSGRPLDAVARGAAAFVAGVDFFDHIQHDYAIRYLNQGRYDYRTIVQQRHTISHIPTCCPPGDQSCPGKPDTPGSGHFRNRAQPATQLGCRRAGFRSQRQRRE